MIVLVVFPKCPCFSLVSVYVKINFAVYHLRYDFLDWPGAAGNSGGEGAHALNRLKLNDLFDLPIVQNVEKCQLEQVQTRLTHALSRKVNHVVRLELVGGSTLNGAVGSSRKAHRSRPPAVPPTWVMSSILDFGWINLMRTINKIRFSCCLMFSAVAGFLVSNLLAFLVRSRHDPNNPPVHGLCAAVLQRLACATP